MTDSLTVRWYDFYDPANEAIARADIACWNAANAAVGGRHGYVTSYEALLAEGPPTTQGVHTAVALRGDEVLGATGLWVQLRENVGDAGAGVAVPPERWGQGIGRALADAVEAKARELGIGRLISWTVIEHGRSERGKTFLEARGCRVTDVNRSSTLRLPVAADRLASLRAEAATGLADAYAVEVVVDELPLPWEADLALLHRRMSTDAPHGLELEEKAWDEDRVRDAHERRLAAGEWTALAVARDLADGHLVGYSELCVQPDREGAHQGDTLVLREHRGHRIGLALKLATLDALREHHPGVDSVLTANDRTNAPMLRVNEAMGFAEDAEETGWLLEL